MSCGGGLQILQNPDTLEVKKSPVDIQIFQGIEVINVCAQNPVPNFLPFYFLATQGQSEFVLPAVALSCQLCAINGTSQSQAKTPTPDFTITEDILTLSSGVDEGDTVFGVIQVS